MATSRFQIKYNIKKGDEVVVIAGDDKNLTAPKKVLQVLPKEQKILVEGVNVVKRHTKPTAANTQGSIVRKELPIHISNVMLWDAESKKATRVKREKQDGKTVRVSKLSGKAI